MIDEMIIEHDSDTMDDKDEEDLLDGGDRQSIDTSLQLIQQSEASTREPSTSTDSQHN